MKSTSTRDFPNFIISKATVITNLLSPFPSLIEWLCGGHYVYNPTLKRFFLFHFLFPFLLCAQAFNHKGIGLVNEIDQSLVFWTDRLSCHLQFFVSLRSLTWDLSSFISLALESTFNLYCWKGIHFS